MNDRCLGREVEVQNSAYSLPADIPLLAEEGWMRRAKRDADGVVSVAKRVGRTDHPGASRHPSSARRGNKGANTL